MPKIREEVPEEDRWNVSALFNNPNSWNEEFSKLHGGGSSPYFSELKSFQGKLKDPKEAASFFELYFGIDRSLSKLHTYAHLRMDEDLGNDNFKNDYGRISTLIHAFQLESAWIEPELLALNDEEYHSLVKHPKMQNYQFYLEKLGRMRPHTLSPEMEEMVALTGKALDTSYKAFGALNNADMTFEDVVDSKGEVYPLSNGSYFSLMRSPDRVLRKNAYQKLHQGFNNHINTLCELLQGQVQSHLFVSKARKFGSCLESALFPHAVDLDVYHNLIQSVRKHLPLMHEYISLRKEKMGLDKVHMYDLYVPLVKDTKIEMNYKDACDVVVDSVAPLGKDYQEVLKKGLKEDRWVDVFENQKKRSGAYSSGCYDSMPYILLNYQGTFSDVETLAHEAGHSMHSYYSRKNQPYIYSHYSIFVAEVASTFNEQLLLTKMKKEAKSKEEIAYLINDEIERIRATIFRQTMFAEFELQIHKWAEEGRPLTPTLLKDYYVQLNRDYYGPDIILDDEVAIEWARIPHFYYNFYVYQYATGLSAAIALNKLATQSEEARDRYLEFLSSGGSRYPLDLLKRAGVDMKTEEPVNSALSRFGDLVKELKEALNN